MTDDNHVYMAQASIGEGLRKFLKSDSGRYLSEVAQQDADHAKGKILELDPYKFTSLIELQNEIASIQREALIAQSLHGYIEAAIVAGNQALTILNGDGVDDETDLTT